MGLLEWGERKNKVWIMGTGRSGTSLCIEILQELNLDTSIKDQGISEYPPVTKINNEILHKIDCRRWSKKALPSDYEKRIFVDPVDDTDHQLITLASQLPEVVKDPRWSVTMPIWIRSLQTNHVYLLPQYVINLTRKPDQVAMSFLSHRKPNLVELFYPGAKASCRQRLDILKKSCNCLRDLGTIVYNFHYPEFLIHPGRVLFANALCTISNAGRHEVLEVLDRMIDESRIHTYEIPDKYKSRK